MKRRTYLGAGAVGAVSGVAGCLDSLGAIPGAGGTNPSDDAGPEPAEDAVLGPPDREHDISASIHPTYGDEIPSYSVPDALSGETISDTDFHGERVQLYTFVFTNCMEACPALLQRLVTINLTIRDEGYRDEAAFAPFTFDPRRDSPEVLRNYLSDKFNVDPSAEDWYFLRPETQDAAYDLIMGEDDGFGLPIEEEGHGEHDDHGGNDSDEHDHEDYAFTHYALILLVNDRGIVERSYPNATGVEPSRIEEDMLAVLEG